MSKTILILGGGFGGVVAANELRKLLPSEHKILLIDKKMDFSMGLSNLWVMIGERIHPEEGQRDLSSLTKKGIEYINEEIIAIDPLKKEVRTSSKTFHGDYLIIALGADLAPHLIPGFSEEAYNFYDIYGALRLQKALQNFSKGKIVILISRTPFKCPAAPYEAAFLIDYYLRKKGLREKVEIELYTPEFQPMPIAGPEVGNIIKSMMKERNIKYFSEHFVLKIDGSSKKIFFEVSETNYDLLMGVPPHICPKVVKEGNLADSTGWIPVHPETLKTKYPGVFALGDITSIRLKNGMFLPKAGIFAERQAKVVSSNIKAEILEGIPSKFYGEGECYIEVGNGKAAMGRGEFYAFPAPKVKIEAPSEIYYKEKKEFERIRLEAWF